MSQLYCLEPCGPIVMLPGSTSAGGELLIHVTKRVLGLRAQDIPSRVKPARCLTGPREWSAKRGTLDYQKKKSCKQSRAWTEAGRSFAWGQKWDKTFRGQFFFARVAYSTVGNHPHYYSRFACSKHDYRILNIFPKTNSLWAKKNFYLRTYNIRARALNRRMSKTL